MNLVPRTFPEVPRLRRRHANVVVSMTGKKLKYINTQSMICFLFASELVCL